MEEKTDFETQIGNLPANCSSVLIALLNLMNKFFEFVLKFNFFKY